MSRMNATPPLTLPRRLKIAREHAEMTVNDMAKALGVGRNTIPRWESGAHTPPLGMVKQWAAETGVSLGYLLGDSPVENVPADLAERRKRERRQARRGGAQVTTHLRAVGGAEGTEGVTIENPPAYRWAAVSHLVAA